MVCLINLKICTKCCGLLFDATKLEVSKIMWFHAVCFCKFRLFAHFWSIHAQRDIDDTIVFNENFAFLKNISKYFKCCSLNLN
jgi:hypothetical protein